MTACLSAN